MPPAVPNPVALITGGAVRVGRAVALRMADAGFDIAITYLTSDKPANQLIEEVSAKGKTAVAIRADLLKPESAIDTIYQSISQRFGRLNLLVNNASLYEKDAAGVDAIAQLRRFWAIHVESPLLLSRILASMLKAAGGCIVNMVDLLGERPMLEYVNYSTTKAALWNATLGLARELAPHVRVNAIAPGVVDWARGTTAEEQQKYLRRVPLARAGTPGDVAATIHFLCTTGTYITGQIIRIDGGRSVT
jgi:pteridine reductase